MSDFRAFSFAEAYSRDFKNDPRLGDSIKSAKLESSDYVVLGYPDDEAIQNGGGRFGASEGPNRIRSYLYKMTPAVSAQVTPKIFDVGNLESIGPILSRHEKAKSQVAAMLAQKKRVLTLGGGHDYGYSDGAGFLTAINDKNKPLVINFDAHLDVRPQEKQPTSGSPFRNLLEEFGDRFDFFEIGIQEQCNSREHLKWATDRGVNLLTYDEIAISAESSHLSILKFLDESLVRRRPAYLSIDMDVFSASFAPGCSQSWTIGLDPFALDKVLRVLFSRLDVQILGIYETAPRLDVADMTSKLAAQIAHAFLHHTS